MGSTFHGIETAKRGLYAQQTAMNTSGHNTANASTKGYSRQVVDFTPTPAIESTGLNTSTYSGQLGTGVDTSIERVRDPYLDSQYRNQSKDYGDWTVREGTLSKIEDIYNEPSETSLNKVMDDFWNAWQDLANQPDSLSSREALAEKTLAMTDAFNDTDRKLEDLYNDLDETITLKVDEINNLTQQIAELNEEISKTEALGKDNANDLRDQRDLLTDDLSRLVNIDVTENKNGYTIKMGETELVSGNQVTTVLDANALPENDIASGELHGYLVSRDEYVQGYRDQLDAMVQGLAEGEFELTIPAGTVLPDGTTLTQTDGTQTTYTGTITDRTVTSDTTVKVNGLNGLHQLGYTLQEPATAGTEFFTTKDGSSTFTAGNITLNPDIKNDSRNIATSTKTYMDGATEKVLSGNNELATWMASVRDKEVIFDSTSSGSSTIAEGTFDEYYESLIGGLGVKAQDAERQVDNQEVLLQSADSNRQSVIGVSLDEEMAMLIEFQHAYNASSRMLTTLDETLDKLINGTGVVGR